MSRKGPTTKRYVLQDPVYHSATVTKLINQVMWDGKKSLAEQMCYEAFEIVGKKVGKDPLEVFEEALKNIMPVLEVRPRRVGGANYQVPIEVRSDRRETLALRWLVAFARKRGEKRMEQRLAGEILDAYNGTGGAVKRKEDTQ